MPGSRSTHVTRSSHKPRSHARRLCTLACAVTVLVVVSMRSDISSSGRVFSERAHGSVSRLNFDANTGGGTGTASALGDKPPVAVYFTGQARTLRRTLCSIRRHILDRLIEQNFVPVVFVAGELDDESGDYETLLGAIPEVEIGGITIVHRPKVSEDDKSKKLIKYEDLPSPEVDALLPDEIPKLCLSKFKQKGRWYHAGGSGSKEGTKNALYSSEVLSQLWYRNVVDRMRKQWEGTERGTKAGPIKWIISPRPDNVYINDLPDLNQLRTEIEGDSSEGDAPLGGDFGDFVVPVKDSTDDLRGKGTASIAHTIYVPNWGEGYDPHAGSGFWRYLFASKTSYKKRRAGVNDRFSFGGAAAISAYHDLYSKLCYGDLVTEMPFDINLEQMIWWYFDHPDTFKAGIHRSNPIPSEFWFFRLRKGHDSSPVENPGHKPAMVKDGSPGLLKERNKDVGESSSDIVDTKRWELWSDASNEVWRCDDSVRASSVVQIGFQKQKQGACLLSERRDEWEKTKWLRRLMPFSGWVRRMTMPGGWLDSKIRKRC